MKQTIFSLFFVFIKVCGLPVVTLLGGCQQESVLLYRAISQGTPEQMAKLVLKYKNEVRYIFWNCTCILWRNNMIAIIKNVTFDCLGFRDTQDFS